MKSFILSILTICFAVGTQAQCVIEHWSLDKRITESSLVIEGKVISQEGVWDAAHKNIYTIHTLEVYKAFKGQLKSDYIKLATAGGVVDAEMHRAEPSLSLANYSIGVFLLDKSSVSFSQESLVYMPIATTESFISYDLLEGHAYDVSGSYHSIEFDLYEAIKSSTGESPKMHIDFDVSQSKKKIKALANPSISSIDIDTVTSGTGTLLTITGSNFGIVRGNGKVGFKDANYGDGRYYYTPINVSYESWSNSQIKVKVPTRAGTGEIQVVNNNGEAGTSSFDLQVNYAHLNVLWSTTTSDTNFYELRHVSYNANGGYSWQMTDNFASKTDASKSFYRSLEAWRCGTLMNWNVGTDTSLDQTASDQVNIVRFDDLAGNRLGTCWSRYSGCYSTTNSTWYWYVRELDIEFDSTYNWHYGENTTPSGQYDFQSVATHELGHGHQLGHVRDNSKIMHYSIGPGSKKDDLSTQDIAGGEYVKDKSVAAGVCGKSSMTALTGSNCQITLPNVEFSISDTIVCPNEDVTITNTTEGNSLDFSWDFGSDASTASASTEGPHTISYSSSGTKSVKLIVENSFGKDSLTRTIVVLSPTPDQPQPFISDDTACLGENSYTLETVDHATNYAWNVTNGGSFVGGSTGQTVTVNWTTSGLKTVTAVAIGECGNSTPRKDSVFIWGKATAAFTEQVDGLIVDFTSGASNAESYLWDFGDGENSSEMNPIHSYPDKGSYTAQLKVSNECGADSTTKGLDLDFKLGISDLSYAGVLYPNPTKSGALITLPMVQADEYVLYDMNGKQVASSELVSNSFVLPKLVDGLYVLKVNFKGSTSVFRLQVQEN